MKDPKVLEFESVDEALAESIPELGSAVSEHAQVWAEEGVKPQHLLFIETFVPRFLELIRAGDTLKLGPYFDFIERMSLSPNAAVRDIVSTVIMEALIGWGGPEEISIARTHMGPASSAAFTAMAASPLFRKERA
jgi:hypothetical protein